MYVFCPQFWEIALFDRIFGWQFWLWALWTWHPTAREHPLFLMKNKQYLIGVCFYGWIIFLLMLQDFLSLAFNISLMSLYGSPVFILLEIDWANAVCRLIFFITIGMFSGIIFWRFCFCIFLLALPFCVCYCCCISHWVLPGSSVHGIFQARILELVAISFSRGPPRDWTYGFFHMPCITGRFFPTESQGQPLV